eukprot:2025124-Pyramimonas_sp.AAC.1
MPKGAPTLGRALAALRSEHAVEQRAMSEQTPGGGIATLWARSRKPNETFGLRTHETDRPHVASPDDKCTCIKVSKWYQSGTQFGSFG